MLLSNESNTFYRSITICGQQQPDRFIRRITSCIIVLTTCLENQLDKKHLRAKRLFRRLKKLTTNSPRQSHKIQDVSFIAVTSRCLHQVFNSTRAYIDFIETTSICRICLATIVIPLRTLYTRVDRLIDLPITSSLRANPFYSVAFRNRR